MTFICYPKCTTCQKAQKWLDENGISYTFQDIKMENPTYEELSAWHRRSGLPLKKFFNTSGLLYKSMVLKETLRGFKMILNGECDSIPESCFLFAGTIDDVLAKAKQQ